MSYSISHVQENGLNLVILTDEKKEIEVAILPGFGALLHAFKVKTGAGFFNVIDGYNDLAQVKGEISRSFKSARLSPFPCRIPDGKYVFEGRESEFQRKFLDGSAIHGLLYDKPFHVTDERIDNKTAALALRYIYDQDDVAYPYRYRCDVSYSLDSDKLLEIQTSISNETRQAIPIADGWHPYFKLGGTIDEWELFFDADAMLEFDERLIPTGNLLKYDLFNITRPIGATVMDNCFKLKATRSGAACELSNPASKLKISFFPDSSYPYLQIFTPPHRRSIAIENLSAAPNCFNNKMGLLVLQPGHSQTFIARYQISWG